jgi:hypothetical protein
LLVVSLAMVAALLLGALSIMAADRWRRRPRSSEAPTANDQLAHFRSLYDQGLLSREEFERIRTKLGGRLRQEMDVPSPPEASPRPPGLPGAGQSPGPTA